MTTHSEAPPPARPGKGRKLFVGVTIAIALTVGLAAALELGARARLDRPFIPGLPTGEPHEACAEHHPDLGWVGIPNLVTRVTAPKFEYHVELNSRGLRDHEYEYAKDDGVFRIVMLGDSVTWGWGVEQGQLFADLVDDELGEDVEVINLAYPGYGTDQHLWIFESEGRRYEPDLVVMCFILNDVIGNSSVKGYNNGKPCYERNEQGEWVLTNHPVPRGTGEKPSKPFAQWCYEHSAFMQAMNPPDAERQLAEAGEKVLKPKSKKALRKTYDVYREGAARLSDELVDPDSVTHMLLRRLKAACDAESAPLIVFSVPHHHDRYLYQLGPYRPEIPADVEYKTDFSLRIEEAGEQLGFQSFAVDQDFLDVIDEAEILHVGDGHPDGVAHRIVANRLREELLPIVETWREGRE
jgi:lysophospholipase L1-like esterase